MKKDIHPKYHNNAVISCSCGAKIKTGSTQEKMDIEICSQCHPFYTGKKKVIDSTGRVDRFKKLAEKSSAKKKTARKVKSDKAKRVKTKTEKEKKKKKK